MKKLNFLKSQHLLYVVAGILLGILLFTFISPLYVSAATSVLDTKLLIIVDDSTDIAIKRGEL